MVKVKQTVLVTASGWGEDGTLDAVWTLGMQNTNLYNNGHVCETKHHLICKCRSNASFSFDCRFNLIARPTLPPSGARW